MLVPDMLPAHTGLAGGACVRSVVSGRVLLGGTLIRNAERRIASLMMRMRERQESEETETDHADP